LAPIQRPARHGSTNSWNGGPLVHRLFRKLRSNDFLLSAMVFAFRKLQRLGISVGPNHFYWPVPDLASLESRRSLATYIASAPDLRLPEQLELLENLNARYRCEWSFPEQHTSDAQYHFCNGFFETVDAEIGYAMVRHFKPSCVIEVGGGFSTRLLAQALRVNFELDGVESQLTTIDPGLDCAQQLSLPQDVSVIQRPVQEIALSLFSSLQDRDILFLDSSHVVSVGSDVVYEYLEVIPRLRKGVLIHAHDIFLPFDYPDELVGNLSFWSEQYLLQAFLSFNLCFEVLWSSSAMQTFHIEALDRTFPSWKGSYRKLPKANRRFVPSRDGERIWPSSFWMRRTC
jgi:hypothetical protein